MELYYLEWSSNAYWQSRLQPIIVKFTRNKKYKSLFLFPFLVIDIIFYWFFVTTCLPKTCYKMRGVIITLQVWQSLELKCFNLFFFLFILIENARYISNEYIKDIVWANSPEVIIVCINFTMLSVNVFLCSVRQCIYNVF